MKVYDPILCMLVEKSDVKKNTADASLKLQRAIYNVISSAK